MPTVRGRLLTVGTVAVFIVAVVLGGAALTRRGAPASHTGIDVVGLGKALESLTTPQGRVELPLRMGQPSLEATAWTRDLSRQVGLDPPELDPEALRGVRGAGERDTAVWNSYYAKLAAGSTRAAPDVDVMRALGPYARDDGTYVEEPVKTRSGDEAYVTLATWAAVQAIGGAPAAAKTAAWSSDHLARCSGNAFTQARLADLLTILEPGEGVARKTALRRCVDEAALASIVVDYPRNEESLLALVGQAMELDAAGWPAPADASEYRRVLGPTTWAWTDPWWAHYSMIGYVAAGGDAADYRSVAQRWLPMFLPNGLMPEFSSVKPSVEQDLFAALTVSNLGIDWDGLGSSAVLDMARSDEATKWGDTDYALWGLLAYRRSAQLSEAQARKAMGAAVSCAGGDVELASMRRQWLCRRAAKALGADESEAGGAASGATARGDGPLPASFFSGLQAAEAVEAAVLFDSASGAGPIRAAVDQVAAHPADFPTHTLAQTLILDHRYSGMLEDAQRLLATLRQRRAEGEFDALYTSGAGQKEIDMYATFWVSEAEKELNR